MNNTKMLYFDRIGVSEGIYVNKTKKIKRVPYLLLLIVLDRDFNF